MFGAGDVRVEAVPAAHQIEPAGALVVVTRSGNYANDLWAHDWMFSKAGSNRAVNEHKAIKAWIEF